MSGKMNSLSRWQRSRGGSNRLSLTKTGALYGYASLFGETDLGRDVVVKGAFIRSLQQKLARRIGMYFQHDTTRAIGRWTRIEEDAKGLFVVGQLDLAAPRARRIYDLIRSGEVKGLSIGFLSRRNYKNPFNGLRRLLEIDLWEISVVTRPMLPGARILAVKSILAANMSAAN